WLVAIELVGFAGVDETEVAPAGAVVAADEERGLTVLPAFEDVGTAGFLTDRVQALSLHQRLQLAVLRAHRRLGLDPGRLSLDRRLAVAHLEAQQPTSLRSNTHNGHLTLAAAGRARRRDAARRAEALRRR